MAGEKKAKWRYAHPTAIVLTLPLSAQRYAALRSAGIEPDMLATASEGGSVGGVLKGAALQLLKENADRYSGTASAALAAVATVAASAGVSASRDAGNGASGDQDHDYDALSNNHTTSNAATEGGDGAAVDAGGGDSSGERGDGEGAPSRDRVTDASASQLETVLQSIATHAGVGGSGDAIDGVMQLLQDGMQHKAVQDFKGTAMTAVTQLLTDVSSTSSSGRCSPTSVAPPAAADAAAAPSPQPPSPSLQAVEPTDAPSAPTPDAPAPAPVPELSEAERKLVPF